MTPPSLSVIVGQYRPRGFLRSAVESVLPQLDEVPDAELVVSLAAPDPEFERWTREASVPVTLVRSAEPVLGRMLSLAVSASRGDVLCFLDDDDRFRPGKLRRVFDVFRADPSLAFYHNEAEFIDDLGRTCEAPGFRPSVQRRMGSETVVYLPGPTKLERTGRLTNVGPDFNSSCMAVTRRSIEPFLDDLARIEAGPDAFLFFVVALLADGSIRCEGARLTEYRLHSSSTSRPGTDQVDALESLHRAALRQVSGQSGLEALVRARGPVSAARLAAANVESHRFFATLRDPVPTRARWARSFARVLPYWSTFVIRSNWVAVVGSLAMALSPRRAQAVYVRRAIGRTPSPVQTPVA